MKVSVIIPSRNDAANLEKVLESLSRQTFQDYEVIIGDCFSTDRTVWIAEEFGATVVSRRCERAEALNLCARVARGEYLLNINSDYVLEPTVLEEGVEKLKEYDALRLAWRSPRSDSLLSEVRRIEREAIVRHDPAKVTVRFFRRDAFFKVGGFTESTFVYEDYDIQNKFEAQGMKIGLLESRATHIGEPTEFKQLVPKFRYCGADIKPFLSSYGNKAVQEVMPVRSAYFKAIPQFGLKFFPFLAYKAIQYLSAGVGAVAGT